MLDALLNLGGRIIGGLMDKKAADNANKVQMDIANQNIALQKDFAQQGVRWKVNDAKAAGIHPLFALGANTTSFSPVSVGTTADTSMGDMARGMGQDLSRAVQATRTATEKETAYQDAVKDLTLKKAGLENEYLAAQIAKIKQGSTPSMPSGGKGTTFDPANIPQGDVEERPPLAVGGKEWGTYQGATNAEDYEKRYGDIGENIAGVANFIQDTFHNLSRTQAYQMALKWIQAGKGMGVFPLTTGQKAYDAYGRSRKRSRMGPN